jgi:putative endonuclease
MVCPPSTCEESTWRWWEETGFAPRLRRPLSWQKFPETEPFSDLGSYILGMGFPKIAGMARRSISVLCGTTDLVRFIVDRFYPWDRRPCPAWRSSRAAGRYGERVAARFLQRAGVKILVRNYRARCGEIDLVGREGEELVVAEVKTRHFQARLPAEDSVTWSKQKKLVATANYYVRELACRPPPVRFDIVEVYYEPGQRPKCRWIQHAYTLDEVGVGWSR